jgi:integrase
LVRAGIDPIEAKLQAERTGQAEARARVTFKGAAEEYWAMRAPGWKNKKDPKLWLSSVERYAYPTLGSRPALEITGADITETLTPIWTTKAVTARRVKQRIEAVIQWLRDGKPLPQKRPSQRTKHHAALPYAEVPAFMADLRGRDSVSARALEFAILTAARTSETIEARWSEFDLKTKVWTVPPERMKAGKQHRVPLSDRAVQILEGLPREHGSEFVFVSRSKAKQPLSNMAMLELLRGMRPGLTVHGMRSSFRDWAGDRTSFPKEVIEHCLAHQITDAAEAAYRRSDALQKRRQIMNAWSAYCEGPPQQEGENVVAMKRA